MNEHEPVTPLSSFDDKPTLIAISVLACFVQDVLHEALGHGVTAWFSGAHQLTLSTVALQSDVETRWVSAAGTLVNLVLGVIFWLLLRRSYRPATQYFLLLALAGNLFTGTGYFLFSGVANFSDWAAVIRGLQPQWLWRLILIVTGIVTYGASVLLVRAELKRFRRIPARRLRTLCWTPYFTDGVLAGLGGLMSPLGVFYIIASALPSTLGANSGLLYIPYTIHHSKPGDDQVGPVPRSAAWIAVGAAAGLLFVFMLGRGISWTR